MRGTSPAEQQSSKNNERLLVFVGRKAFVRFSRTPQRARYLEQRRAGHSLKNLAKTEAREARNKSPNNHRFWRQNGSQNRPRRLFLSVRRRLGQASDSQKRQRARIKRQRPAQECQEAILDEFGAQRGTRAGPGRDGMRAARLAALGQTGK